MTWSKGTLTVVFQSLTGGKCSREIRADMMRGLAVHDALGVSTLVDWTALNPAGSVDPVDRQFLRQAVDAVCNFCGAFEIETPMDRPGGHA